MARLLTDLARRRPAAVPTAGSRTVRRGEARTTVPLRNVGPGVHHDPVSRDDLRGDRRCRRRAGVPQGATHGAGRSTIEIVAHRGAADSTIRTSAHGVTPPAHRVTPAPHRTAAARRTAPARGIEEPLRTQAGARLSGAVRPIAAARPAVLRSGARRTVRRPDPLHRDLPAHRRDPGRARASSPPRGHVPTPVSRRRTCSGPRRSWSPAGDRSRRSSRPVGPPIGCSSCRNDAAPSNSWSSTRPGCASRSSRWRAGP